jgi:transketolase
MNVAVRKTSAKAPDVAALKKQAAVLRGKVIEMSHAAQAAHLASSLSCADVLAAAYWHVLDIDPAKPLDPLRDRFILSKGHAAAALFATLAMKGYFPMEELST